MVLRCLLALALCPLLTPPGQAGPGEKQPDKARRLPQETSQPPITAQPTFSAHKPDEQGPLLADTARSDNSAEEAEEEKPCLATFCRCGQPLPQGLYCQPNSLESRITFCCVGWCLCGGFAAGAVGIAGKGIQLFASPSPLVSTVLAKTGLYGFASMYSAVGLLTGLLCCRHGCSDAPQSSF